MFHLELKSQGHRVTMQMNTTGCPDPPEVIIYDVSFDNQTFFFVGSGTVYDNTNYGSNPGSGFANVLTEGGFCIGSASATYDFTNSTCGVVLLTQSIGGGSSISAAIRYMAPPLSLSGGGVANSCGFTALSVSGSATQYRWYVSENGSSNWQLFKTTTSSSISVNADDLQHASFISNKYGSTRYVRVSPSGSCSSYRTSNVSGSIVFAESAPFSYAIVPSPPSNTCSFDGSILIEEIFYLNFPNSIPYNQEPIQVTISSIGTSSLQGALSYTISGLGTGTYNFSMENGAGTCTSTSSNTSFTINSPPSFSVSNQTITNPISCNSSNSGVNSDGEITATLTNGKPPFDYYLKKNTEPYSLICSNCISGSSYTYTGLDAGVYQVQAIDDCGLTIQSSNTITLSEPDVIAISSATVTTNYNGEDLSCATSTDGSITVAASGGTGMLSYSIDNGSGYQPSGVFNTLGEGVHVSMVRDVNNCAINGPSVSITPPSAITISSISKIEYNGYNLSCTGSANGQVTITASGGTGTLQYYLDGNSTPEPLNIIGGLAAGAHSIIVEDANNCESSSQPFTLTTPPALSLSGSVTSSYNSGQQLSCNGANDGQITLSGTGGVGILQYSIDNGINYVVTSIFNNLSSGTYLIKVQDINDCVANAGSIVINDPPTILATETLSNFNGYQLSCNGATDGAIALNVTGGAGSYTYSWDSGQTTKDISGLTAGNYTVTITDANNCPEQIIYTLNEPFILSESIITSDYSGTNISCNGAADGFIDLDITGGAAPYTYNWSTGASTQDLASLVAGTYSVTVTDANNCINIINNIILNEPDVLSLSIGSNINVQCNGTATGEVTLSSLGGGTGKQYSLDGINYQASNTFSGLVAGSYTFDVIDANGCSNQINTTLTEPTLLIATIGSVQNTTCGDLNGSATITAVGGVASYTYTWRNAANTIIGNSPVLSGVGGGIYEVTVIDANGCSIMQSANISSTDGPQTTAAAITPTTCFNSTDGSATLNITGAAPFDVAWANGETELTATSLQSGNNTVVITDNNGCVAVEVVNIPSPSTISISNIINTQPTCFNSTDGVILVDATGGSGGYTYAWSNGTTGNQLSGVTQGTYTLTITDSNGCQLVQEVELIGVESITTTLVSQTTPTCEGDTDGQLVIQALGGNGSYTYAWAGGQTGSSLSSIGAGVYEVTITDAKGCFVVQHIELEDADLFVIDPFEDVIEICTGSSYIADYNLTGASYSWSANNGFASTSNEVTLTQPGNYQLTVTNQNGCVAQDGFELVISNDLLNADFLLISEAYVGDTVFVIDISWPAPEALIWGFANNVTVLEQGLDYAAVIFNEPNTYAIDMTVQLADCSDFYTQTINILDRSEKENINGRVGETQELITQFDVYPNPNFGDFSIDIELAQEANIQVQLIDLQRNTVVLNNNYSDELSYSIMVQRYDLKPGLYLVTLKAKDQFKAVRIMIRN